MTTRESISRLKEILNSNDKEELKRQKYYGDEYDNGNGSLMRIIPLLFYIKGQSIEKQFEIIWDVSALTHRHIRAAMCCLIYLRLAEHLLDGMEKNGAYLKMREEVQSFWETMDFSKAEQKHFNRMIQNNISETAYDDLYGSGYVIKALEASLWCFLNESSFERAVFAGINLGEDTDTTAAIIGGLGGIYFGLENISKEWINSLARVEDIIDLGNRLHEKYS